jgi:hypothetical protein
MMSKVSRFLFKHPTVDGYTLICVCEEINRRRTDCGGVDGILTQALRLEYFGKYLVSVCESFQNQSSN